MVVFFLYCKLDSTHRLIHALFVLRFWRQIIALILPYRWPTCWKLSTILISLFLLFSVLLISVKNPKPAGSEYGERNFVIYRCCRKLHVTSQLNDRKGGLPSGQNDVNDYTVLLCLNDFCRANHHEVTRRGYSVGRASASDAGYSYSIHSHDWTNSMPNTRQQVWMSPILKAYPIYGCPVF